MDILYAVSLLILALSVASRYGWTPRGWIVSWCTLLALAGTFRIFMQWFPEAAPSVVRCAVPVLAVYAVSRAKFRIDRWQLLWALPWVLAAVFMFVRSYFAQFDVDSLEYHLVSVRWLQDRHWLSAIQQHYEGLTNWLCVVGFEEFLSIPGLAGDLPLCAGLVGGVLKVMSLLTLISILPERYPLLRYATTFLLLIDDHFFFSGQSTWVYLNPSLQGFIPLLFWTSWRAAKGSSRDFWLGLALVLGISTVKLYGLFFAPLLFLAWAARRFKGKGHLASPGPIALACLLMAGVNVWSTLGFRFLSTGQPLPPLGTSTLINFYRGQEVLQLNFYSGSIKASLLHPLRNMLYPGALAMKMTTVLIFPILFLWLISQRKSLRMFRRVDQRALGLSCAALLPALGWVMTADVIYFQESRYPRYALGLCILGLMFFATALRKYHRRIFLTRPLQWVVGFFLFLWIVVTIDTRYVNVGTLWRPRWKNIAQLAVAKAKTSGKAYSLDLSAPYTDGLFMKFVPANIPALSNCLADLEQKTGQKLTRGEGLVIGATYLNWPSLLIANNAVELGMTEGGGYLRLPGGKADLAASRLHYAIVKRDISPDGSQGPYVRQGVSGPLEGLTFDPVPLCVSNDMKVVRLTSSR